MAIGFKKIKPRCLSAENVFQLKIRDRYCFHEWAPSPLRLLVPGSPINTPMFISRFWHTQELDVIPPQTLAWLIEMSYPI